MLNSDEIRKDFPILKEPMNNKPLVYLDSAATSLKPWAVLDALNVYNQKISANVYRGVYKLSSDATELYESARLKVAGFINACRKEVIFTKNATEALNIVAFGYGLSHLKSGDQILTTALEHHSSFLPWQRVAKLTGAEIKFVPLNKIGAVDLNNFEGALTSKTKVVAINHVSNVMGYLTPIKEICVMAHKVGAVVSVDAAQSVPHIKVDVRDMDCDFLSFTGHKMLGPTGVGVLYGKQSFLKAMEPFNFGGEMIDEVNLKGSTFKDPPYKFEAGTPPIAGAIGLKSAIDYLENIGDIYQYEENLLKYAIEKLSRIEGVTIYNKNPHIGIIAYNVEGVHPHDMASVYDSLGICVRAGHHCAQLLMKWLNQPATLRASIYLYNTKEDIDALADATILGKETFDGF